MLLRDWRLEHHFRKYTAPLTRVNMDQTFSKWCYQPEPLTHCVRVSGDWSTLIRPVCVCVSITRITPLQLLAFVHPHFKKPDTVNTRPDLLPVIDLDVLVSLWVIHEPHQLQMEDRRESEELHSFFCFLQSKTQTCQVSDPDSSFIFMLEPQGQL